MAKPQPKTGDKPALIWLGIISVLTHLPWIILLRTFTSGDWWYIGIEKYRDFAQFSPIWVTDGIGNTSAVPHFYLIRFLEGVLTYFGSSFALNEKIFFLVPMTFGATFGTYFLLRRYFSTWPSFIGSMVFAFNTAVLFNHVGPLTIGTAYALAPWCIYLFKRYIDEINPKFLVGTALVFSLTAVYELRIAIIIGVICASLFIFNCFVNDSWQYAKRRLVPLMGMLGLFLLLHTFWIAPYVISARSGVTFGDLLSRGLFVSFSDLQNAMTLHHPFWTGSRPATFVLQDIPLYAWLIPIAAFGGFALKGKRALTDTIGKEMYFWGLMAAAGLFLVKQVNEPFINIYPWLFGHVPGFGAYRESSKFYLMVALAYAVLIPFTLTTLKEKLEEKWGGKRNRLAPARMIFGAVSVGVLCLFLVNTIPLLTGSFRTLYIPRTMPNDYRTFNAFVDKQDTQFRTLWVPVTSRWGVQSNDHPALLATGVNQGDWLGRIGMNDQNTYATLRDKAIKLFNHPSSADALDRLGVKYVVVPLRDTANEDDFFRYYGDDRQYYINQLNKTSYLQKIDIGTKDLAVYENKNYQPYISAFTDVQSFDLDKNTDITTFYSFVTGQTDQPFNFIDSLKAGKDAAYPTSSITNVFQQTNPSDIHKDSVSKTVAPLKNPVLYISPNSRQLRYEIKNKTITFYARDRDSLSVNGAAIDSTAPNEVQVGSAQLNTANDYYLSTDDKPLKLRVTNGSRSLGIIDKPLTIYAASKTNLIPNHSFESGLWQKKVADCNNYDSNASIAMKLRGGHASEGSRSLQLEADKHTACTFTNGIAGNASHYFLSFDYSVAGGRTAGYEILFNDKNKTTISEDITTNDSRWHHYQKIITAPTGATAFAIKLLGYPDYRLQAHAITNYDDMAMYPLTNQLSIKDAGDQPYSQVALSKNTELTLSYPNKPKQAGNHIPNGSIDKGLWQKKVADCNDFDATPVIGMKAINRSGDGKALELSATRHDACTSNSNIKVNENTNYMFSFDYQSINAASASYFLRFDDPAQTTIEESIPITGSKWQTYTRQIKAPLGATRMNLVVYARSADTGNGAIVNRYDSFDLQEIPDLPNRYFIVDEPTTQFATPKKITFNYINATRKTVHIGSASKPFYLRMSEAYHPLWKVRLTASSKALKSPLDSADMLPEKDHFRLNDFQNGWYIDPQAVCSAHAAACTKNSDGSYDIAMVIEFTPQRWFHTGLIVSTVTLAGCVTYLIYRSRRDAGKNGWRWHRS